MHAPNERFWPTTWGRGPRGRGLGGPLWWPCVGPICPLLGKGGHTWLLGTTNGNYKPMARHAHATCAFGKLHTTPTASVFWLQF